MSNGYGRSTEGFGISREQSVNLIVGTCLENGVTDKRQIAYILATAEHETRNFNAPEEDFGRSQARKLGYGGGEEYFGRGYVHLTHKDNYATFDKLLGMEGKLVSNPGLATDPELAAKIMVIGMRDGLFTGKPLDRYINEDKQDFYNARRVVNGVNPSKPWSITAAHDCESKAAAWERKVPGLVEEAKAQGVEAKPGQSIPGKEGTVDPQREALRTAQQQLNGLGYKGANGKPLVDDGLNGPNTRAAVEAFQREHGLTVDGKVGPQTLGKLDEAMARSGQQPTHELAQSQAESPLRIDQKGHTGNPLYVQAQGCMSDLCKEYGKAPDARDMQAAGAMAALAHGKGLVSIDRIVLSDDRNQMFAMQGEAASPSMRFASMPTMQALGQSLEQSTALFEQAQQQKGQEQQQAQSHAGPTR